MRKFILGIFAGTSSTVLVFLAWYFFPIEKDWLDLMGALSTSLIGITAVFIAYQQLQIKQQEREQLDFDKRWLAFSNFHRAIKKLQLHYEYGEGRLAREEVRGLSNKMILIRKVFGDDCYAKLVQSFNEFRGSLESIKADSEGAYCEQASKVVGEFDENIFNILIVRI